MTLPVLLTALTLACTAPHALRAAWIAPHATAPVSRALGQCQPPRFGVAEPVGVARKAVRT